MRLNLIYARAKNGVIGRGNALPWHLPEDLAHFKATTAGCPVIMGRKTWDSLPPRFRPLPGRLNLVLSRDSQWYSDGAVPCPNLASALQAVAGAEEVWVIGGAEVYRQALPLAQRVVVTEIDADFDGDAWAPVLGTEWQETQRHAHMAQQGLRYALVTYEKS
jgi:dihydrofolate reductase